MGSLCAAVMTAGPDGSPRTRSHTLFSRSKAPHKLRVVPVLGFDRLPSRRRRPSQLDSALSSRLPCLSGGRGLKATETLASAQLSAAQAMRASLLATATVTTRAGRRTRRLLIQAAFSDLLRA
jgi:hypothetical protein